MRLDISTLQRSCQWAFQGCSCSLTVIDVGGDANAAGRGIIFCLTVCAHVCESDRNDVCACVYLGTHIGPLVCVVGPAGRKVPCQKVTPGETPHAKKCQHHWKWSWGKCGNGVVWELPLCQKQLVRMRSRERGLINYLHILDWHSR